jgi:hypothetical protein
MAGRPPGAQNKDKPFRDALRMELTAAGEDHKALRAIARNLIDVASNPDITALPAIREIADRIDGKVPQTIGGDDDASPVRVIATIERIIVSPSDTDS